jgi:23S rRNA (guanosine2251-2'-O)-methyltransferase
MKPPHSNRPGGSGHGPSNRDPGRGFGGTQQRSPGGSPRGQPSKGGTGEPGRNYGGAQQRSHGGPSRGQSPQGAAGEPGRNYGGAQQRSYGGPSRGQSPQGGTGESGRNYGGAQQRSHGGPSRGQPHQGRSAGPGQRDDRPRNDARRHDAPRNDAPRDDRPSGDRPRLESPRPISTHSEASRGHGQQLQARPRQDDRGNRHTQAHPQPNPADSPRGTVWLYGVHAVAAALANPARRLRRLVLTEDAEATLTTKLAPPWPLQPERVDRARLDNLLGRDIAHQGVALLADPLAPPGLQPTLERAGTIIVLDQVTDPRNVGAILRSAAAFAVAAVITQDRNAPEETGALAKAASGALETIPLLRAVNIARTLVALKASNCWVVGLDAGAKTALSGPALADRRVALVLGAEGEGLRRLTRETCDELAGLAMPGAMESLNVSAAGAVALYELTRRG